MTTLVSIEGKRASGSAMGASGSASIWRGTARRTYQTDADPLAPIAEALVHHMEVHQHGTLEITFAAGFSDWLWLYWQDHGPRPARPLREHWIS